MIEKTVKIIVECRGGIVQAVHATPDETILYEVEVLDYDELEEDKEYLDKVERLENETLDMELIY